MARPSAPHAKVKLLAAAEAEFVEHGLERAKVEGITARAGVSKGAFYIHFASKDDAFRQLVEGTLARLARFVEEGESGEFACAMGTATCLDEFLAYWLEKDIEVFEFVWQNRGLMALLFGGGSSKDYVYLVDEFAERTRVGLERILQMGVERGFYRKDLDIEIASAFVAGAYDRLARQMIQKKKKPDFESTLRQVQRMVIRGVGSPELMAHIDPPVTSESSVKARSSKRMGGSHGR